MKISLLTNHPVPRRGSIFGEVLDLLRKWDVQIETVLPSSVVTLHELRSSADLYLLKSSHNSLVGLASALEVAGARCLNPTRVVRLTRDRVATAGALAASGVPVPQSWSAGRLTELAPLLADGALVLKAPRVASTAGPRVLWDVEDMLDVPPSRDGWLVQRFHPSEHRDRKIYRIGAQVFGVKRRWPARTLADKRGEPFTVDEATHAVTDRMAKALGTDLFGADIVQTDEGPVVVEVHPFPGFKGVPDGALRLADYIYSAASEAAANRSEVPS